MHQGVKVWVVCVFKGFGLRLCKSAQCRSTIVAALVSCILVACGGGSGGGSTGSSGMGNPDDPGETAEIDDGSAFASPPAASSCVESLSDVELTVPTILRNSDSACDYVLDGTIRVAAELTIEPGTVVLMRRDAWIVVDDGSLNAVGTADQRIQIRGEQAITGFWQGIRLTSGQASRIVYVDLMDAGNSANAIDSAQPGAVTVGSSVLSLVDSSISNSARNGAVLGERGTVLVTEFARNRFFGNREKPMIVQGSVLPLLDSESDYLGVGNENGDPVVEVVATATAPERYSIRAINVPYRPVNAILASVGQEITLEPGVHLELGVSFGRMTGAGNGGRYVAIGTPENPVVFSQSASIAVPNAQPGSVEVEANGMLQLQHVRLQGVALNVGRNGTLEINDAIISNSPGYGIFCAPRSNSVQGFFNVMFDGNALGDVSVEKRNERESKSQKEKKKNEE